jgi:proteasome lid subunit RPN8/RPN11
VSELVISKAHAEQMIAHCVAGRPNEACGILGVSDGRVVEVFKMTNAAASPVRYSLDPKEQLEVYRTLDYRGWALGGVFHSHTHTDAYPSPTDVRLATEDVPYVIVSLARQPSVVRAFRIRKETWDAPKGDVAEIPVSLG